MSEDSKHHHGHQHGHDHGHEHSHDDERSAGLSRRGFLGSATGVTAGDLLEGVRFFGGGARTHSLVMAYQTKQVRFVDTVHMFDRDSPPRVRL